MMKKLHFSIVIQAPRSLVWSTMLDPQTYEAWTQEFSAGSRYEGSWDQGATIRFLIPSGDGTVATIAENRPHEFISIRHLGNIRKGVDDTTSDEVRSWAPAFENYTFIDRNNGTTELRIDADSTEDFEAFMLRTWPKALDQLKSLCETH